MNQDVEDLKQAVKWLEAAMLWYEYQSKSDHYTGANIEAIKDDRGRRARVALRKIPKRFRSKPSATVYYNET